MGNPRTLHVQSVTKPSIAGRGQPGKPQICYNNFRNHYYLYNNFYWLEPKPNWLELSILTFLTQIGVWSRHNSFIQSSVYGNVNWIYNSNFMNLKLSYIWCKFRWGFPSIAIDFNIIRYLRNGATPADYRPAPSILHQKLLQ